MPEPRKFDVEMLRDFVSFLALELQVSLYESENPGQTNPEFTQKSEEFMEKYGYVGLLPLTELKVDVDPEYTEKVEQLLRGATAERRRRQLKHLKALAPLLDQALDCLDNYYRRQVMLSNVVRASDILARFGGGETQE